VTWLGLRRRWHVAREQWRQIWAGPPHGCDPYIDIDRRLTKTPITVIFDVGANRGQSALQFHRWFPSATLHCFEPVPATFAHLQQTVRGWPHVYTHMCALGSSRGRGTLQVDSGDDSLTRISTDTNGIVAVETLDEIVERLRVTAIDYLKIDTEGRDLEVLEGAARLLSTGAVAIVEVEAGMHRDNPLHVGSQVFAAFLEDFGYRLFGVYEQTLEWPSADAHLRRANLVFVGPETIRRNRWPKEQVGIQAGAETAVTRQR